ncbi:MAG TPA: CPBP family intramembrane metalloprotease, partial [Clostridia bacterium]|nr:CPBP family intramembrane metalloprotease [Clostridia bacterium]
PVLCFVLSTTALGVIIGQIARTTDSILLAIVFHFTVNFTGELIPLSGTGEMINAAALALTALGIACRNRTKKGMRNESGSDAVQP